MILYYHHSPSADTFIMLSYCTQVPSLTVQEICEKTSIRKEDVIATLKHLQLLLYYRGQHVIVLSDDIIKKHYANMRKRTVRIDPSKLKWTPKDWSKRGRW